jgi:hypothetical protein
MGSERLIALSQEFVPANKWLHPPESGCGTELKLRHSSNRSIDTFKTKGPEPKREGKSEGCRVYRIKKGKPDTSRPFARH